MVKDFKQAVREDTHLLIAVAGNTGSGKTLTAMRLAAGLCGDDPFLLIDTEGKRGLHYAPAAGEDPSKYFRFERMELLPPFHPEKHIPPITAAQERGFKCAIIDSASHEWEGEGGMLEMADANAARGMKQYAAWADPKKKHRRMVNAFLQARIHLIFCLRSREKLDLTETDERGKVIVKSAGELPICEKNFMYEMTTSFMLTDKRPGVPDYSLPHKIHDMHRFALLPGKHVTEESGRLLGMWARGEDLAGTDKELWDRARTSAYQGRAVLELFVTTQISPEERKRLRPIGHELNDLAREADALTAATEGLSGGIPAVTEPEIDPNTGEIMEPVAAGEFDEDLSERAKSNISDLFGDQ